MRSAFVENATVRSGVGHRSRVIKDGLRRLSNIDVTEVFLDGRAGELLVNGEVQGNISTWPGILGNKSVGWLRLRRLFQGWLYRAQIDVLHLSNQSLSFLVGKSHVKSVVTVHDLIELQDPQSLVAFGLNRYLYNGIKRADHLIAVSEYTKRQLVDYLGIEPQHITVVLNGVDADVFHPLSGQKNGRKAWLDRLGLGADAGPILLFVGSDHPRKNVSGALRVLAKVRLQYPKACLVKLGSSGLPKGRADTERLIKELGLGDTTRLMDQYTDGDLNELMAVSDLLVQPSFAEGFGLPVLQALAAGLPVVCSNAASLPEVVEEAALIADPDDIDTLTKHVLSVLDDEVVRSRLRAAGLVRAGELSWDGAADRVADVYSKVVNS